jgi:L-2-hydroxyglutarate oxidase LhgO
MRSLLQQAEVKGVVFAPLTKVISIEHAQEKFLLNTEIGKHTQQSEYQLTCRYLVNSAGLGSQNLASKIDGLPAELIPALHYCKGDYFNYLGKNPFTQLIYPLPEQNTQGLGIHGTLDMSGQLRFGPDAEFVDSENYDIDSSKARAFAEAISRYFPAIEVSKLVPAYAGIRPKIGLGDKFDDFQIQYGTECGFPGLLQLFGLESPGLTSSLAIAEELVLHLQNLET